MKVYFEESDPYILLEIPAYRTNIRPVSAFSVHATWLKVMNSARV